MSASENLKVNGRELGFYWVKKMNGTWAVAEWDAAWFLPGIDDSFEDDDFLLIDETPLVK